MWFRFPCIPDASPFDFVGAFLILALGETSLNVLTIVFPDTMLLRESCHLLNQEAISDVFVSGIQ